MALSFPSNPTTNQIYTYNGKSWTFDGTVWSQTNPAALETAGPNTVVTTSIVDGAVTAVKLAAGAAVPSQTGNTGKYLTTDGTTASWATVDASPADGSITAVKLGLGTTYLPMAIGTTTERPSSPAAGYTRINTTTNYFEVYYNGQWINLQYIGAMTVTYTGTPTISTSNGYTLMTFTSSGSITVTNAQAGSTMEYLVVAGGGGGGNTMGGGGGAGGLSYDSGFSPTINSAYSFTIGAGGAGAPNRNVAGTNGSNTTAFGLTMIGGGGGSSWAAIPLSGGSGGGGGGGTRSAGAAGTAGQGYAGGNNAGTDVSGSGGGGATAAGTTAPSGPGGAGYTVPSWGGSYSGGGGGGWGSGYGTSSGGAGGLGGGGQGGQVTTGTNGTVNTGGGGGGGGYGPGTVDHAGGSGASGTVIIRYRST